LQGGALHTQPRGSAVGSANYTAAEPEDFDDVIALSFR
jgi:hypothetical protein